jgi:hypothetical protein
MISKDSALRATLKILIQVALLPYYLELFLAISVGN